jgi:CheY-like chemotaxis protein
MNGTGRPSGVVALAEHSPVRVLVVDDSDEVRDLIRVNLELEGYDVRTCHDGAQALAELASWLPDVVTLDVVMPRMDGFATLAAIRADPRTAGLPVVLVTGRAQAADREQGTALGADAFLSKPFEPADLVATVSGLAARRR